MGIVLSADLKGWAVLGGLPLFVLLDYRNSGSLSFIVSSSLSTVRTLYWFFIILFFRGLPFYTGP